MARDIEPHQSDYRYSRAVARQLSSELYRLGGICCRGYYHRISAAPGGKSVACRERLLPVLESVIRDVDLTAARIVVRPQDEAS